MVRRVLRRLLPPLVLVLAAVVAFTVTMHPATQWFDTARQVTASLTFLQNWHLADSASDYLAADPSVSPLQHLWSISVQGQFYLAALVLVFGLAWLLRARGLTVRGPLAMLLGVLAIASLTYATTSDLPQTWLYYDTAARMWELLVGGLLACAAPYLRVPRVWRVLLAVAGLAIVVACGMVLDGRSQFPGPWALVPVGAALAIIVAGARGDDVDPSPTRLLASPPLVRLGSIAYALYLWHWPFLIAYLVWREEPVVGSPAASSSSALPCARRTHHPPDRDADPADVGPARSAWHADRRHLADHGRARRGLGDVDRFVDRRTEEWAQQTSLDSAAYPGAAALLSGADVEFAREQPSRFVAHADLPATTLDGCMSQDGQTEALNCTYGDTEADRSIALIGGSHAEHWLPALDELGHKHRFRVETYVKVGCPAVLPPGPDAPVGECEEWTFDVLDAVAASRPDIVFSTSTRPRRVRPATTPPTRTSRCGRP